VRLPPDSFAVAADGLRRWEVHRRARLDVLADAVMAEGALAALAAPLPVGWIDFACRIVAVVDSADRAGFAYGTLSDHPEIGEEAFMVMRDAHGVRFEIVAVSRPGHPIARAVPWAADRLQEAATRRYLSAMQRICAPAPS
jgi:uncharacterized protein (UPF0548 family)